MKYRIFLSSTFNDLRDLRRAVIDRLTQAGLFYFAFEFMPADALSLEKRLQAEIDDSDIFVLLVRESLGSFKIGGIAVTQFEFEYARERQKPVLAYFTDEGSYGSFASGAREFKSQVSQVVKYNRIQGDDYSIAGKILGDILYLVTSGQYLAGWVRSDISSAEIDAVIAQKNQQDMNTLHAGNRIVHQCERFLSPEDRDRLIGPLVDAGLRQNISGTAYRFVIGCSPEQELRRDKFRYEYCLDRFSTYESGAVYDRKLNLSWYRVPDQTLTWNAAMNWEEHLTEENCQKILKMEDRANKLENQSSWRLPRIEELMSLLTYDQRQNAYIDQTVFPGEIYWFWSSTRVEGKDAAYYVETALGQVLKDTIAKLKGVILCTEGLLENAGRLTPATFIPSADDPEEPVKTLQLVKTAKRIYGVYLAAVASTLIDERSLPKIYYALSNAGYHLSTFTGFGSRPGSSREIIQKEMINCDYFVVVFDISALASADESAMRRTQEEIQVARELGLQIIVFHNLDGGQFEKISRRIELIQNEFGVPGYISDPDLLAVEIVNALYAQQRHNPRPGWIQAPIFEAINKSISSIDQTIEKLEQNEDALLALLSGCGKMDLRPVFEKLGVLTEKPTYGVQTRFVSKDTPIQRLMATRDEIDRPEYPILYVKIVNRFRPLPRGDANSVIYDQYLKLRWWNTTKKYTTFEEAIEYAQEISVQEHEEWRLPTINELMTLITRKRGERKYMDELVFPVGRWFWTKTVDEDQVFYVDFNYPALDKEDMGLAKNLPLKRKSVLLVAKGDSMEPV